MNHDENCKGCAMCAPTDKVKAKIQELYGKK